MLKRYPVADHASVYYGRNEIESTVFEEIVLPIVKICIHHGVKTSDGFHPKHSNRYNIFITLYRVLWNNFLRNGWIEMANYFIQIHDLPLIVNY